MAILQPIKTIIGQSLGAIGVLLAGAVWLSTVLHNWLRDPQKQHISDRLDHIWLEFSYSPSITVIHSPIRALRKAFDFLLGPNRFSRRAFTRTAVVGNVLLIASLSVGGVITKVQFMGANPWSLYDLNRKAIISETDTLRKQEVRNELLDSELAWYEWLIHFDSRTMKAVYCIVFIVAELTLNAMLDFCCVVLVRQLLQELESTQGYMTLLAALTLNVVLAFAVSLIALFLAFLIAFPTLWTLFIDIIWLVRSSPIMSFVAFVAASAALGYLAGPAIHTMLIIATLPTLLSIVVLIYAVVGFPLKRQLHSALEAILLRVAESGKGAFIYVAGLLTLLALLISAIVSVL